MLNDFKNFIMRGNVVDMAVGVIIGAAFGKIVTSLVSDILMPPIGFLTGGVDFSNLFLALSATSYATLKEAQAAGVPTINYGVFLDNVISFLIVAGAVFILIRQIHKFMPKPAPAPAPIATKECPFCLSGIPVKARRCAHCTADI